MEVERCEKSLLNDGCGSVVQCSNYYDSNGVLKRQQGVNFSLRLLFNQAPSHQYYNPIRH